MSHEKTSYNWLFHYNFNLQMHMYSMKMLEYPTTSISSYQLRGEQRFYFKGQLKFRGTGNTMSLFNLFESFERCSICISNFKFCMHVISNVKLYRYIMVNVNSVIKTELKRKKFLLFFKYIFTFGSLEIAPQSPTLNQFEDTKFFRKLLQSKSSICILPNHNLSTPIILPNHPQFGKNYSLSQPMVQSYLKTETFSKPVKTVCVTKKLNVVSSCELCIHIFLFLVSQLFIYFLRFNFKHECCNIGCFLLLDYSKSINFIYND